MSRTRLLTTRHIADASQANCKKLFCHVFSFWTTLAGLDFSKLMNLVCDPRVIFILAVWLNQIQMYNKVFCYSSCQGKTNPKTQVLLFLPVHVWELLINNKISFWWCFVSVICSYCWDVCGAAVITEELPVYSVAGKCGRWASASSRTCFCCAKGQ